MYIETSNSIFPYFCILNNPRTITRIIMVVFLLLWFLLLVYVAHSIQSCILVSFIVNCERCGIHKIQKHSSKGIMQLSRFINKVS